MFRKTLITAFLFFGLVSCWGCAGYIDQYRYLPTLKLHKSFERDFRNFKFPDISRIKAEGHKKIYPHATFDAAWDAVVSVSMQEGVIIYASKGKGLVAVTASPPLAFLIEHGDDVAVYVYYMEDFYDSIDGQNKYSLQTEECKNDDNAIADCGERVATVFFDKISAEMYTHKKSWQYLYK